jgi:hypothetical protein
MSQSSFTELYTVGWGENETNAQGLTSPRRAASPFWRSRNTSGRRESPSKKSPVDNSGLVVGAAYSHADMLKFDNLYVSILESTEVV